MAPGVKAGFASAPVPCSRGLGLAALPIFSGSHTFRGLLPFFLSGSLCCQLSMQVDRWVSGQAKLSCSQATLSPTPILYVLLFGSTQISWSAVQVGYMCLASQSLLPAHGKCFLPTPSWSVPGLYSPWSDPAGGLMSQDDLFPCELLEGGIGAMPCLCPSEPGKLAEPQN